MCLCGEASERRARDRGGGRVDVEGRGVAGALDRGDG